MSERTLLGGDSSKPPLPYRWTTKGVQAAQLVAEGKLTNEAIAKAVGWANPATLWRHKKHPDFQARVDEIVEETAAALKAKGIAERQYRIDALVDRQHLLERVIAARAASDPPRVERGDWVDDGNGGTKFKLYDAESMPEVPGWDTGILTHQIKVGKDRAYDEYSVDTGMLAEMRAHEKQVAQELGEWSEKRETKVALSLADLDALLDGHD